MQKTKIIKRKLPLGSTKGGEKAKYQVKANGKLDTGKPTKKTPEVLSKLQEALMKGCTEGEACAYAGIAQVTLIERKNADLEFAKQIDRRKDMYVQAIKFASFERAMNTKNRDATDILFKVDKRYSDKQEVEHKGSISLVDIARQAQSERLDKEKGEEK